MDTPRRLSAFQNLLKIFGMSNDPAVLVGDDDPAGEVDEPPEYVPEMEQQAFKERAYCKTATVPRCVRRESLLTRAILGDTHAPLSTSGIPRALSTASSQSVPSTAELTSDGDLTSPTRSASPSPPLLATRLPQLDPTKQLLLPTNKVTILPLTKDDKPDVVDVGEAAVEKTLGRKRCIMFACGGKTKEPSPPPAVKVEEKPVEQPRKCRLTFVCPSRQAAMEKKKEMTVPPARRPSPAPTPRTTTHQKKHRPSIDLQDEAAPAQSLKSPPTFHEFGDSQDETDAWVNKPGPAKPKLTLKDVMKKENEIRQITQEAEDEAAAEEEEQEAFEAEMAEDEDNEDDFAPSDEDDEVDSDGGNESDDEGGFAESDDESEDGSEYRFWAPSPTTTAATSNNNDLTHFSSRQRSRSSSLDSTQSESNSAHQAKLLARRQLSKAIKMRPGTPELPDSTDFVCGTLDEDRPLEAAYISCREQRKRDKHVLIPQDIDPSFPTSDPEDAEEDDEDDVDAEESGEPMWLKDQFRGIEEDSRGRRPSAIKLSPPHTTTIVKPQSLRPQPASRKGTNRSPPPPKHRSPPPRRLFGGHSPTRLRSPPPRGRYRSPRGSPTNMKLPLGITINRLAQRPSTDRTASLPHTPNPFFKNWKAGSPAVSCIPSGAITPAEEWEEPRPDLHVRGPVDIVIGLEKKRQKRKEKLWRQHCRKAAKEQAEKKPVSGRGVERMKELGLECAERNRGYGLGQPAKLVISL